MKQAEAASDVVSRMLKEAALLLDGDELTAQHAGPLRDLKERLAAQRLHISVLGQFKRGKSTFLNALLGAPILPTSVLPLTSIPTFISWQDEPAVRIRIAPSAAPIEVVSGDYSRLRDVLARYASEGGNPENALGVSSVEVGIPAPLLEGGDVFIDTPGIGSTHRHNTDEAFQSLPQCDLAIIVLSPDPPITEAELDFLSHIEARTEGTIFVVNKMDTLSQIDGLKVLAYVRTVVGSKLPALRDSAFFGLSSRDALAARSAADRQAAERSGIQALEKHLRSHLAARKATTLQAAIRNKAAERLALVSDEIALRIRAYEMPLTELKTAVDLFSDAVRDAYDHRSMLPELLEGRKRRILAKLERKIAALRADVDADAAERITRGLEASRCWSATAADAHAAAIMTRFDAAQADLFSALSRDLEDALATLQSGIGEPVGRIRETARSLFGISLGSASPALTLQVKCEPYWVKPATSDRLMPDAASMAGYFASRASRASRLKKRLLAESEESVVRNAESLRWFLIRTVDETFLRAHAELQDSVEAAVAGMDRLLDATLVERKSRHEQTAPDLLRLRKLKRSVNSIETELQRLRKGNGAS